jgi:nucleoid DNA-binding protein
MNKERIDKKIIITGRDVTKLLSYKINKNQHVSEVIIDTFVKGLIVNLKKYGSVSLKNFGIFYIKKRPKRTFILQKEEIIPARYIIKFEENKNISTTFELQDKYNDTILDIIIETLNSSNFNVDKVVLRYFGRFYISNGEIKFNASHSLKEIFNNS